MRRIISLVVLCLWAFIGGQVQAEVIMTEVYPAPSEGFEWVEICNTGPEGVSLAQYTLLDSSGKKLTVPQILLASQQYVLATSSSVLNNTGDAVYLQKNGLTIESMNYDTAVNAQQSYISCNAVWTLTNIVTPGFENIGCSITPQVLATPTSLPTITQSRITPTTLRLTPYMPLEASISLHPTAQPYIRKRVSFQQKHATFVLGEQISVAPSTTPKRHLVPQDLHITPLYNSTRLSFGALLITLAILLSGLTIYRSAQRFKNSYNEIHDT